MPKEPISTRASQPESPIGEVEAVHRLSQAFAGTNLSMLPSDDPEVVQARITQRVMHSTTLDQMFDVFEGPSIEDFDGKIVTVHGADWSMFNAERGQIPMAHLKLQADGEDEVKDIRATAENIVAFVANAIRLKALPFRARVVAAKTSRGYTALHFGRP